MLMPSFNHSTNRAASTSIKNSPVEDVYIMLICISLISFFAALIVPVVCVKPNRKFIQTAKKPLDDSHIVLRKQNDVSLSKELIDDDDSGGFLANRQHRDQFIVISLHFL